MLWKFFLNFIVRYLFIVCKFLP